MVAKKVSVAEAGGAQAFMAIGAGGGASGKYGSRSGSGTAKGSETRAETIKALPARKTVNGYDNTKPQLKRGLKKRAHIKNVPGHIHEAPPKQKPLESDNYNTISENAFKDMRLKGNDFSTFSIDVDTASYSDMRSHIQQYGRLPQASSIRIEEFINYFDYGYEAPNNDDTHPFRYHVESAQCPWNSSHQLMRIGIQGKRISKAERPATNLVFLIDVSGSMHSANKLPLLKHSFRMLVQELDERDSIAIVAYAGASGLVLPATNCNQ
ncbi:MAG: von Willebrand factor type A domain-containing protein, partial [Planctomycetes bacterium]|nr:von Willebrand factor type A domain-containing protein [Planctomycetota bacterium]